MLAGVLMERERVVYGYDKEVYPGARPRVISDNGPQFIAKALVFLGIDLSGNASIVQE